MGKKRGGQPKPARVRIADDESDADHDPKEEDLVEIPSYEETKNLTGKRDKKSGLKWR